MSRGIILCADDYGLSEPVSRAILDLAKRGRLSAISCMTVTPLWREHGKRLFDVKDRIDVGLHLTLAGETPLTHMAETAPAGRLPGIAALIVKSHAGRLNLAEIAAEVNAQFEAFVTVTGQSPAHIDGHLHAHVLPGIRQIVLDLARRCSPTPWIRSTFDLPADILRRGAAVPKALFIAGLGYSLLAAAGDLRGRMNDGFSGIYGFDPERRHFGARFGQFVRSQAKKHLIQCHPGLPDAVGDPIGPARAAEYRFLASAAFPEFLARENISLARFADAQA